MNKKKLVIIIILIILLNIIIRIPTTPTEKGWDSYFIHDYALGISNNGYIKWNLNPLSLFGLYPYSYASGVPIILSSLSLITGINIEYIILILSIIIGGISFMYAYLLANKIFNNQLKAMLTALLFSTSLYTLYYTTWTMSARALFFVLLPFYIYVLLKNHEKRSVSKNILILVLIMTMAIIHHLFVYAFIPIITLILLKILTKNTHSKINPTNWNPILIGTVMVGLIVIPFLKITKNILPVLKQNTFNQDILSLLISYLRFIGPLIILYIIGLIWLIFKNNRTYYENFLLICTLLVSPLICIESYTMNFLFIFVFLIITQGIYCILNLDLLKKFNLKSIFIVILIITSLFLGAIFQNINIDINNTAIYEDYMPVSQKSLGNWMSQNIKDKAIGFDTINNDRLNTVANCKVVYGNIQALICDDIDTSKIIFSNNNIWNPAFIQSLRVASSYVLAYNLNAVAKYYTYFSPEMKKILLEHNIRYYVEYLNNKNISTDRIFTSSIKKDRNKIYDNGENILWYIG